MTLINIDWADGKLRRLARRTKNTTAGVQWLRRNWARWQGEGRWTSGVAKAGVFTMQEAMALSDQYPRLVRAEGVFFEAVGVSPSETTECNCEVCERKRNAKDQ